MHVLVTADTIGGVWTYTAELVTGLVSRGHRVTLVSLGEIPTAEQTEWMEPLRNLDFRPTGFRLEWMQDAEEDLRASAEFIRGVVDEVKPDLIHSSQFCYGSLDVPVPRIVVAHSCVLSWWDRVHDKPPKNNRWINGYRDIVTRGIEGADLVAAPSRWMLEQVTLHYARPKVGTVVYNGRSPERFVTAESKREMALCVGRLWDSGKNVALLLNTELPMTTWIIGSERHPESQAQQALEGIDRNPRLHLKGPQSESALRQLYSRASIYIATSRYEPFGLAPLEAALSRCALVMNDIPTFRELWGDSALYFRYNDAHSLSQVLRQLAADQELLHTYAHLAHERAMKRFTCERMVSDYLDLYASLVPAGVFAA